MGMKRVFLLFAAAAALAAALPEPAYAQFGGLANMAKGKAAEALTNGVMKALEKTFTDKVAREPISEAAKAEIVKKLSEMARPIVKKFVDAGMSGSLPNVPELTQTVLKDVLPKLPELLVAAKGGGAGAPAQAAQAAPAFAAPVAPPPAPPPPRELPKIAVYAYGAEDPALNKAMTTRLIADLADGGRYAMAEDYREFFEQAAAEQGNAAYIKSGQVKNLGARFGVGYVCVAEVSAVLGESQISAYIVDVNSGALLAIGAVDNPLKSQADLAAVSVDIASAMRGRAAR
jgi:hypothetical protein